MSTTSADVRVSRTRAALVTAVEEVLEQGSWAELTIGALCTRARISRPTFYQHFPSMADLLGATIRHRLDQTRAEMCVPADGPEVLAAALVRLHAERGQYACLSAEPTAYVQVQAAFEDWLVGRVQEAFPHADPVAASYAAGGIARVMGRWLATDSDRPTPEELARSLWLLNRAVLELTD
ncbi:TetR/AcrR family transcriptional regulator [Nocardioides sp. W7]|uniref:TetR/AcrR family transcriptional regulator n=1 Tax=Nocardioides sp. W7 TaxID=2931390 RepID=UPI001FD0431B|nr:TetR/AcrR family transcriptional regulator [Nocardioides sp. W7]